MNQSSNQLRSSYRDNNKPILFGIRYRFFVIMRAFGWCYIFSVVFSLAVVALASVGLVCL